VARQQSRYICQTCGAAHLRWEGQCRTCGGWNTLVETVIRESDARRKVGPGQGSTDRADRPQSLAGLREAELVRIPTGIGEIDRVLGGGLVPGSVVLLGKFTPGMTILVDKDSEAGLNIHPVEEKQPVEAAV
jgi:DNA repair protein RadA/Sms